MSVIKIERQTIKQRVLKRKSNSKITPNSTVDYGWNKEGWEGGPRVNDTINRRFIRVEEIGTFLGDVNSNRNFIFIQKRRKIRDDSTNNYDGWRSDSFDREFRYSPNVCMAITIIWTLLVQLADANL